MEGPAGRRVPAGRVRTRMIGDFRLVAVTVVLLGLVGLLLLSLVDPGLWSS
jgi:hypothetical protein